MSVVLDTSAWPLVRWTVTGRVSAARCEEVRDLYVTEVLDKGESFIQLWDLRDALAPDPKQRHHLVELFRPLHEIERRQLCAEAWVSGSWLVRGALSALHLMLRPPYPSRIFATLSEGEHFIQRHHPLHPRRASVPPRSESGIELEAGLEAELCARSVAE